MKIKTYYNLTKPGIIYGNLLTASAGFFLGSLGSVDLLMFSKIIIGFSLTIAAACVFNNIIDRKIDKLMTRTKNRALPTGKVSVRSAAIYGLVLLAVGSLVLSGAMNDLSKILGIAAFLMYVFVYAAAKRLSTIGTVVGAFPGASPPVIAYVMVRGVFDVTALILFLILFTWQIAHFYSIAIYRFSDYKNANLPVMPVKKGANHTTKHILSFVIFYIFSLASLTLYGQMNLIFLVTVLPFAFFWLQYGIVNYKQIEYKLWAKKMFLLSLLSLTIFSFSVTLNSFII